MIPAPIASTIPSRMLKTMTRHLGVEVACLNFFLMVRMLCGKTITVPQILYLSILYANFQHPDKTGTTSIPDPFIGFPCHQRIEYFPTRFAWRTYFIYTEQVQLFS